MMDPAELVYWRRRAIAVAAVLGIVLLVIWAVSGPTQPAQPQAGAETNTAGSTELSFNQPPPAGEPVGGPSQLPGPVQAGLPGSGLAAGSTPPSDGALPSDAALPNGSALPSGSAMPPGSALSPGNSPSVLPGTPRDPDLAAGNPGLPGAKPGLAAPAPGAARHSTPARPFGSNASGSPVAPGSALSSQSAQPQGLSGASRSTRPGDPLSPASANGDFGQQGRLPGARPAAGPPSVVPPGPIAQDAPSAAPSAAPGAPAPGAPALGGAAPGASAVGPTGPGRVAPKPAGAAGAPHAVPVVAACSDQNIALVAQVSAPAYKIGQRPLFRLVIANIGERPCSRDLDPGLQGLVINGPAGKLWASNDCDGNHRPDVRVLDPGKPLVFSLNWAGRTSNPGCAGTRQAVGAGSYQLVGKLGPLTSGPAPFNLTS
jgi:hypothetical protein